jgi:hypothetical protein
MKKVRRNDDFFTYRGKMYRIEEVDTTVYLLMRLGVFDVGSDVEITHTTICFNRRNSQWHEGEHCLYDRTPSALDKIRVIRRVGDLVIPKPNIPSTLGNREEHRCLKLSFLLGRS